MCDGDTEPLLFHRLRVCVCAVILVLFLLFFCAFHINSFPQILQPRDNTEQIYCWKTKTVHNRTAQLLLNQASALVERWVCALCEFGFVLSCFTRCCLHVDLSLKSNRINYNLNYLTFWLWFHKSFSRFYCRRVRCHFGFLYSDIRFKSITILQAEFVRRARLYRIQKRRIKDRAREKSHWEYVNTKYEAHTHTQIWCR